MSWLWHALAAGAGAIGTAVLEIVGSVVTALVKPLLKDLVLPLLKATLFHPFSLHGSGVVADEVVQQGRRGADGVARGGGRGRVFWCWW